MATASKPIRLSEADYERTLRLVAEVRVAELELTLVTDTAKRKLQRARDAQTAHLQALGKRYRGFHPEDAQYTIDDATRTLHVQPRLDGGVTAPPMPRRSP